MRTPSIDDRAHDRQEHHPATNSRDQQTAAALRVAAQAPQGQREDGREAGALEREDAHQEADGQGAGGVHGREARGRRGG